MPWPLLAVKPFSFHASSQSRVKRCFKSLPPNKKRNFVVWYISASLHLLVKHESHRFVFCVMLALTFKPLPAKNLASPMETQRMSHSLHADSLDSSSKNLLPWVGAWRSFDGWTRLSAVLLAGNKQHLVCVCVNAPANKFVLSPCWIWHYSVMSALNL